MPFPFVSAVNMIPGSGEFTYDTIPFSGRYPGGAMVPINAYFAPGGARTDLMYALDDLQNELPNCRFIAIVVQWMGSSLDASICKVYPSSTYLGGAFQPTAGGAQTWRVSDVSLETPGVIPISKPDGMHAAYGGTPSDQSIVRCIQEIRRRGLKVALYLQMNMDAPGRPWRGRCGYQADLSEQAVSVVNGFFGAAAPDMFTPDPEDLTVHYSGSVLDFTYRRFVLHYAWLCTVAGGVDLFTIGSELCGLEAIRGPTWTPAGSVDSSGCAEWDYPFVRGLQTLIDDSRSVFDAAGFKKNLVSRENLIVYSADWSQWMGAQHPGIIGIFPHLDPLFAMENVDFVSIDNYLPLSDWTTGDGGLDARNWRAASSDAWPTAEPLSLGFGLTTPPQLHDLDYLKGNIERGEKADYFYSDYSAATAADPNGSGQIVTAPSSDRLAQQRRRYYPGQELFALKKLRWWWRNSHRAVFDANDGQGAVPRGAPSAWIPQSKSIAFMEYGFPSIDRGSNEENVFYDPGSIAGGTPFWCVWEEVEGGGVRPAQDQTLQSLAHQAWNEYWTIDGHNETSSSGVKFIADDLMFAWTWDARPFPLFPLRTDIWSDGSNWRAGHWLCGKGLPAPPPPGLQVPVCGAPPSFPPLAGEGWSIVFRPGFRSGVAARVSGRETRCAKLSSPLWAIELTFESFNAALASDVLRIAGFYESVRGRATAFLFPVLADLGLGPTMACRFEDDQQDLENFMARLFRLQSVKLVSVRT